MARQRSRRGFNSPLIFSKLCRDLGLDEPVTEHRFHPVRRWRFDYAWPDYKIALEVEGGVWTNGRHTRGTGFVRDMEKYNAAGSLGWRVFRCVPDDLCRVKTVEMILEAVNAKTN